ncbi:F-box domain containing protein [Pandoravirus salinus]|uniref:F-box domain containing protein n=1 Tax=Pandoravirus salinus TaxID=1349410 RepID=S4VXK1_9VIRU|nr:F-box domain [Pandoravirus salinus]AGO85088.1 F-box domain containing protein [Pandoravirus salinus]
MWASLPDEIALTILAWCSAADLGRLSTVDRRLRRLALDESLWKAIYERAFPPCLDDDSTVCLYRLGLGIDTMAICREVDGALDRLLDPDVPTAGPEPDLSSLLWALGSVGNRAAQCPHWWPTIFIVRGYRWAFAVAATEVPRFFGPHIDASPATLVGRVTLRWGKRYRGDLERSRRRFKPHGHGIVKMTVGNGADGSDQVEWVAARWEHGAYTDEVAASYVGHAYPTLRAFPSDARAGFGCGRRGSRTFIHNGAPSGSVGRHTASVVRSGPWRHGLPMPGGRMWTTVGDTFAPSSAAGIGCVFSKDAHGRGIVRDKDGRAVFVGDIVNGHDLVRGQLFSGTGAVLYDGDIPKALRPTGQGRIRLADGRVLYVAMDPENRQTGDYRPRGPTIIAVYPNGDRATYYGDPPQIATFARADGRVDDPPAGWNMIIHVTEVTTPDSVQALWPLLQNTVLRVSNMDDILRWRDAITDGLFWPRSLSASDRTESLAFLDYMAARHGARWARCRAAVRVLCNCLSDE